MPRLWLCPQLTTWEPERSPPNSPSPLLRYLGELAKTLISFKCFPRIIGLPRLLSGKESSYQCRRCRRLGFDPWVRKIPWRREWQPTPIFLPGESMDRGTWRAIVYEVEKVWHNRAQLLMDHRRRQINHHSGTDFGTHSSLRETFCFVYVCEVRKWKEACHPNTEWGIHSWCTLIGYWAFLSKVRLCDRIYSVILKPSHSPNQYEFLDSWIYKQAKGTKSLLRNGVCKITLKTDWESNHNLIMHT